MASGVIQNTYPLKNITLSIEGTGDSSSYVGAKYNIKRSDAAYEDSITSGTRWYGILGITDKNNRRMSDIEYERFVAVTTYPDPFEYGFKIYMRNSQENAGMKQVYGVNATRSGKFELDTDTITLFKNSMGTNVEISQNSTFPQTKWADAVTNNASSTTNEFIKILGYYLRNRRQTPFSIIKTGNATT